MMCHGAEPLSDRDARERESDDDEIRWETEQLAVAGLQFQLEKMKDCWRGRSTCLNGQKIAHKCPSWVESETRVLCIPAG
jgi:hypothetical protein